jgi:hypothetical protein
MRNIIFALFMAWVLAVALHAQLNRGSLTGTVTDPTGAVVPGVKITIQNTATNATYETESNAAGQYTMPNLPTGPYQLTFSAPGLKQFVRSGVTLGATEVLRVDATLEVGAVTERIEITAEVPRLQTETPEVGTSLSNRQLVDLPLSFSGSRHVENFAYKVSPGVSGGTWTSHINGSTSFSKDVLLDGAPTTTYMSGDMSSSSVSVEALQEFKIQTSGVSAEFGRTQTGVFNYIMKSGTNEFHGSAFGALRNEALNANSFANKNRGAKRSLDRKNTWAVSGGGPIFIPKIYDGRNRTFFYLAYERYDQKELTYGAPNTTAPLPEFYDGNLSRLLGTTTGQKDALGRDVLRGAIYDPLTFQQLPSGRWVGEMFPGNQIPVSRISQVAKRYNDIARKTFDPPVRDANGQIPLVNNSYRPSGTPRYPYRPFTAKADQIISTAHKLSGSYTYVDQPRWLLDDPQHLWSIQDHDGGPLSRLRYQTLTSFFVRLAEDWTISPRLLNHGTLFYNRYVNRDLPNPVEEYLVDGAEVLGIKGLSTAGRGFPVINWGGGPLVTLNNTGSAQSGGSNTAAAWGYINTLSYSTGRHFMKFGFDLRRNHFNQRGNPWPSFTFNARATAIPNEPFAGNLTGHSFASYLLGIVDSASYSDPVGFGQRRHYYSLFFQDDFKVNSRLSVNIGLRWEYQPPATEVGNRLSSWNPTKTDPETGMPGAYDFAGNCSVCTGKTYFGTRQPWRGFGPRLGIAYRPLDKWTVRAAYGIMFEGDLFNNFGIPMGKAGSVQVGGTYDLSADPVNPWQGIFNWDAGVPYKERYLPPSYDLSWGNRNTPGMYAPEYGSTGYSQQFNLNVQRELPRNVILDIGYVGNKSTSLRNAELARRNQLPPSVLSQYGANLNRTIKSEADAALYGIKYPYPGFNNTLAAALRQYPQVRGNSTISSYGDPLGFGTYHSLQVTVNRQFAQGLTTYANYVWSKTLNNMGSSQIGGNSGPLDYYNLSLEKSLADYDLPHMFKAYVDYQLPFGKGKPFLSGAGKVANALVGGWSVSGILNYFSGTPLAFAGSAPLSGGWNGARNRANIAAGNMKNSSFKKSDFQLAGTSLSTNTYLNKSLFSDPVPLTLGTSANRYGQVRNFGTINEDVGLLKSFTVSEKYRGQLRAEFLNIFNRHNLSGINTSVTSPLFGQVTGVGGNRVVQLSARFDF